MVPAILGTCCRNMDKHCEISELFRRGDLSSRVKVTCLKI